MIKVIEKIHHEIRYDLFSDTELINLFQGSGDQRYGLIKRAIAKGELIHLRRGLYYLAERYRRHPLNLFAVALKIYGPSYVSLESALSFHGWIPEAVQTVTSVSQKRSRRFETPLGAFHYSRVVSHPFLTGVHPVSFEGGGYLMASPWKAIADYVYVTRKNWDGIDPLIHSLRVEEESLQEAKSNELNEIEESYSNKRVQRFLSGVRKDLNL